MSDQWEKEVAELQKAYAEENEAEHGRIVRAMSEALAQSGALAVANCCLEVSSAEALIKRWEEEARYTSYRLVQATLNRCASDLRREMASAKSRQPQDNK